MSGIRVKAFSYLLVSIRGLFSSKFCVQRNQCRHDKSGDGCEHDPDEKIPVAQVFLQRTAPRAGQHCSQCHKAGADRVVSCLMLPAGDIDHVEHVGGEAETVTELFQCQAGADHGETRRLRL